LVHLRTGLTVSLLTIVLAACSSADERILLNQFFAASRLRDLTALRNVATVVFEPATEGIVTSFELLGVTVVRASEGQALSEEVAIDAPVRLPDGNTVEKTFVVTLQRGLPESDPQRSGGWMITAIKAAPASPSTPRR
jgi:hypothetical protein